MSKPGYTSISLRAETRQLLQQLQDQKRRESYQGGNYYRHRSWSAEDVISHLVKKALEQKSIDPLERVHRPRSESIEIGKADALDQGAE